MASISGSIGGNPYASFPSFTETSQKQHAILETLKQNFAIDTLVSAATQQIQAPSRSSNPNIPLMGAPQLESVPVNIASINKPQVSLAAFLNTLFNLSVLQFQLMSDENTVEESVSTNDIANFKGQISVALF